LAKVVLGELARQPIESRDQLGRSRSQSGDQTVQRALAAAVAPQTRTPQNLLRLSVGLEDPADLVADLDAALAA
jgi:cystathionine gamma-synthase